MPITVLVVIGLVIGVVLYHGYKATPGWVGVTDKKFWDYLELLIVPGALAFGVYVLNRAQREREREAEDAQQERELEVENQRAQDEALQAYFDQMSQLLLDKDRPLQGARPGDASRTVARARTLTVLPRLNGARKARVVQFLYESGLILKEHTSIDLTGADLSRADLSYARLRRANLRSVNLVEANLAGADLEEADLEGATLTFASLKGADLKSAKLGGADLSKADLSDQWRIFSPADPEWGMLMATSLWGTDLAQVSLKGADLTGAVGVTNEGLWQLLRSELTGDASLRLEGATMPNGQKYDVWLKSKGRTANEESSEAS